MFRLDIAVKSGIREGLEVVRPEARMLAGSKLWVDPGLFEDFVGGVPGIDGDGHWETMPIDRAFPEFVAALTLPDQTAPFCNRILRSCG